MIRVGEYATLPLLDVPGGVALGSAVVSAVPADSPEFIKVSARGVHATTAALQSDWAVRVGIKTPDRRPHDLRNDRAWSALYEALDSASTLKGPRGVAAAQVLEKVFKEGLAFTQFKFDKQWAHAEQLLKLIKKEALEQTISQAVGGPEHLQEVKDSHVEYGAALNITEAEEQQAEVNLAEALSQLRDALNVHVSQLIAWANQAPENEPNARAGLKPIDDRRGAETRSASSGQAVPVPDVTPQSPLPAAP